MKTARAETERDQVESAFTPVLRRLRDHVPALLTAAFVDVEGECIDYVSVLPPYDAKVHAAHMHHLFNVLCTSSERLSVGEHFAFEICAGERETWVQRVAGDYLLVVLLEPEFDRDVLRDAISLASAEFRIEVGLDRPAWEGAGRRLSVRVRAAVGWTYAPQEYSEGDARVTITDVLGRWTERDSQRGEELVCFRVRTADGQELTLVHDPDENGWIVRD
jgi:predicted regulator of Ras-like GTPase activity (Roadblock/LC7/MglB family)